MQALSPPSVQVRAAERRCSLPDLRTALLRKSGIETLRGGRLRQIASLLPRLQRF